MWALDGISRSQAALGRPAEAARSLEQALASFDQVRARFRSEEFKMGLFSDLQKVFERAIGLYTELDQPARAFDISERSRARALLDSVSDRGERSEEHTSELQSLMRISYAVFCLKKKINTNIQNTTQTSDYKERRATTMNKKR